MGSPDLFPPRDFRNERRRRLLRRLGLVGAVLVILLLIPAVWMWLLLLGSRPQLDGEVRVPGLSRPVAVSRDALGIPTILCDNRLDAAVALGFLHGQERFFQMDLLRRRAAGELAALVGAALLPQDRSMRLHRFRARAREALQHSEHRQLAEAYAQGVNAGLASLHTRPFEYFLLRTRPEPWSAEDIFLVVYSMYHELQGSRAAMEISLGVIHDTLPEEVATFVAAPGSGWEALLQGTPTPFPDLPDADTLDLRHTNGNTATPAAPWQRSGVARPAAPHRLDRRAQVRRDVDTQSGSNAWAVAGSLTVDETALLAGDMHLGLTVPNIWYRASLSFRDSTSAPGRRLLSGFSLPGAPLIIVGSNGDVAWSVTAGNFDQSDVVLLDMTGPDSYRTADGSESLQQHTEIIEVAGADPETLVVHQSRWGPVVHVDASGRPMAHKWVAHDPDAVNFGLLDLEQAATVVEAVHAITRTAVPGLNCVLADRQGSIAWTVAGLVPRRFGFEGRRPRSWADGQRGWDGYLAPGDVPRVINPPQGIVWSANNRPLAGNPARILGEGGYVLGARACQIRDALQTMARSTPLDHLALQLDDRAVFLERWQKLLLQVLSQPAARNDPMFQEMRQQVENWGAHASIGSVGYRIVRNYHYEVVDDLMATLLAPCIAADASFRIWHLRERERPAWQIVSQRPAHLLPEPYETWDAYLLQLARRTGRELVALGPLEERTWGERNTTRIQHPLSLAVPFLSRWLDMPRVPLPGDGNLPRVQSPDHGASQRLVVLPGREDRSLAHMPCGQSGHPLSPNYRSSHRAWMQGEPTPLLPGPVEHVLQLYPSHAQ
jgi:penicillin amidase